MSVCWYRYRTDRAHRHAPDWSYYSRGEVSNSSGEFAFSNSQLARCITEGLSSSSLHPSCQLDDAVFTLTFSESEVIATVLQSGRPRLQVGSQSTRLAGGRKEQQVTWVELSEKRVLIINALRWTLPRRSCQHRGCTASILVLRGTFSRIIVLLARFLLAVFHLSLA